MPKINYVSTASFCVENARELGIAAAILLDKIVRLSKYTTRQDGFCWYTAKQFEEETSLSSRTFDNAARKLEECGIIERKITYIIGTMTRATHFKLVKNAISEPAKFASSVPEEFSGSVNTINNTINMSSSADASSDASKEETSPFDENIIPDVRTKSNADSANANKKAGKVVVEMCKVLGRDARGQGVSVANAKKLFAKGYTYEELIGLAEWAKKSDFYKEKPLHTILGNDAMQQYQVEKNKTTEKGIVKGFNL